MVKKQCILHGEAVLSVIDDVLGSQQADGEGYEWPGGEKRETIARRIHANLQHPDKRTMITILKRGKAKLQLLKAAEKVCDECELCNASGQKKTTHGARTPEPADYEFNHTVGVDVIFVDDRWDDQQKQAP